MRDLNTMISQKALKAAINVLSGNDVKNIHLNLQKNLIPLDSRKEQIYLFTEEFVPINYLIGTKSISDENKDIILNGLKTSILPPKTKKLKELYNICVNVGYVDSQISYKSKENLNSEISRILNKEKFENLKEFLNDHEVTDYASEFLTINGITPNMYRSKMIMIYSALLNYDWSILSFELTSQHDTLVSILVDEELLSNEDATSEKWSKLSSLFKLFLDQLLARTIHYDN